MRILQVCSARTLGGGERHVAALADALAERGHQVYLAITHNSPLADKLRSVPAENVITLRMRNAFDIPSALKLARVIREQKIEIVHAHLARDYPLASLAVRRYARLIVTRHVLFSLNRLHKFTLSNVARVIAVSGAVARALSTQHICDDSKIIVVPNGIDLTRFDKQLSEGERQIVRSKLGVHASFLVGTVGSLLPKKGHEDFIRTAALLHGKRDDVEFVIVGDDEERNRDHRVFLERRIIELGIQKYVRIVNWTEDLSDFYQALDIYVSSSHSEAFGLSIVEAMASRRAVVATGTEGAKEIIEENVTGLLVPISDVEMMAQAITNLLDDATERSRLVVNGYERARERYHQSRMIDAVEKVYIEAAARQSS